MNLRRHLVAVAAALLCFLIMTILSASWGEPSLIAGGGVLLACTALFFHNRRKVRTEELEPVTPGRDDRVIPQDVKIAVAVRDKGKCQIKGPPCTVQGEVYDHIYPWSKGGSSKDPDNIQMACKACNRWKSDKILV